MKRCFGHCGAVRCTPVPGRSAQDSGMFCAKGKWDLALYLSCIPLHAVFSCLAFSEKLSGIPEVLLQTAPLP